jgi:hypothetical protein
MLTGDLERKRRLFLERVRSPLGEFPRYFDWQVDGQQMTFLNIPESEQAGWMQAVHDIYGSDFSVVFTRDRPETVPGVEYVAKRSSGSLDIETLACGCRAVQIPGEDDWQLVRSVGCTLDVHTPKYLYMGEKDRTRHQ